MSVGVFGYGSLVAAASAAETVGRPLPRIVPARLGGWRRRWSQARDNLAAEKTFALADGSLPPFILGLNVEPGEDEAGPVNGAVIELEPAELERLDLREIRYDRVEVGGQVETPEALPDTIEAIVTYAAKPERFAPEPPPGAVILAAYSAAVEAAFAELGEGELEHFRTTTGPHPVEVVEAALVKDEIPPGNPRAW